MLKELVQELNEILGAVETLTAENENMKNEIKVKENRIVELEAQAQELTANHESVLDKIKGKTELEKIKNLLYTNS